MLHDSGGAGIQEAGSQAPTRSRFGIGSVVLASVAYWLAVLGVFLEPAVPILWRMSKPGGTGDASISFGDGALKFALTEGSNAVWSRQAGFITTLLVMSVPPIVFLFLWVRANRRREPDLGVNQEL